MNSQETDAWEDIKQMYLDMGYSVKESKEKADLAIKRMSTWFKD